MRWPSKSWTKRNEAKPLGPPNPRPLHRDAISRFAAVHLHGWKRSSFHLSDHDIGRSAHFVFRGGAQDRLACVSADRSRVQSSGADSACEIDRARTAA